MTVFTGLIIRMPPPGKAMAGQVGPSYADAVTQGGVPFLWLCGPSGVGKSAVGYEIFQQVYRSGIKAARLGQRRFCRPHQDHRGPRESAQD